MDNKATQSEIQKTPKLRFSGFSDDWEEKKLGNLTRIYDGTHQTPHYVKEGIPFYSVEHLTANDFSNTKFVTKDVFEKENQKVRLEKNDILMTRIGDIGTARLINWDVKASFYVSLALIKQSEKIHSLFLTKYISSSNFKKELWKRTIHVAFPKKINLGEIGECKLFNPSILEQQKIAEFLESTDEWIENLRKQREFFESFKKGMMQKIFAQEIRFKDDKGNQFPKWEEKKLGEVAIFRRGSFPQPYGLRKWYDDKNGFPFVQVFDVDENFKLKNNTKRRITNEAKKLSVFVEKGTIVLTIQGSIGRIALTQYDACVDRTLLIFKSFNKPVDKVFFMHIVFLLFEIEKKKAPGGTIKTITKEALSSFKLFIPSLQEQQKIAEFLTSIDKVIESKQQQIDLAESWKKGLMQRMFV